jgi:nucleoside-diphosphate-sugar epimerase
MLLSSTDGEQLMSKGNVTVLGSNGHIGHAAMQAFADAGWSVTGLARANRRPVAGTKAMVGDASDLETVKAAIATADVVVHALHLRYDQWGNGRSEAQLQVVLDAMKGSGKTLLFPGTIYNYRAKDRTVSPDLRQDAEAPRGEIRIRLEQMLRAGAAKGDFQAIILRAGDFYGPGNRGEWFESAMLMDQAKGKLYHMGDLTMRHSWAYLPDLGRAFAVLAARRSTLNQFENFHFSGHWVSHGQMMHAIEAAAGRPLKVSPLAWWTLGAIGLVNPLMRDIYRMRYLWQNEMELVDPRLDALLGDGFTTPFDAAVATTVEELLTSKAQAAA